MEKFKAFEIDIQEGSPDTSEIRVVKVQTQQTPVVSEFRMPDLRNGQRPTYESVKAKFGPLAATDPDRMSLSQKDRRFVLNDLVRGPLSVAEEESRLVDSQVQEKVAELKEEARAEGFREGHAEGLEKGYQEAFQQFTAEGVQRLERLDGLLQEAEAAKATIFAANEKFLLELVMRVSRMILLKELSTDPQYVVRLVRELVEKTGVRENIRIRLSPEDVESVNMIREDLMKNLGTLKNISIEPSGQVSGGGCMVETDWSLIDASLDTQIQNVYSAILGNPFADEGVDERQREQA